jgi:hypothetical protein
MLFRQLTTYNVICKRVVRESAFVIVKQRLQSATLSDCDTVSFELGFVSYQVQVSVHV